MAKNFKCENHKHPGGDKMCIGGELRIKKGGKLIVEEGANVEGLMSEDRLNELIDAKLSAIPNAEEASF